MALTADDLGPLDNTQKEAVLSALYVALIADGAPNEAELETFAGAIARLPWGQPLETLQAKIKSDVLGRLSSASREGKIAFLQTTVPNIPVAIRLPLMQTMVAIAFADKVLTRGEKGSLSAFATAFGLTEAQIDTLRAMLE
jgi:hypothetical protein